MKTLTQKRIALEWSIVVNLPDQPAMQFNRENWPRDARIPRSVIRDGHIVSWIVKQVESDPDGIVAQMLPGLMVPSATYPGNRNVRIRATISTSDCPEPAESKLIETRWKFDTLKNGTVVGGSFAWWTIDEWRIADLISITPKGKLLVR